MAKPETKQKSKISGSERAADDLFQKFVRMINSGDLADGQPLPPEREIVEKFGVSRTVVRETITALSNKGLIEARPRFRPIVRKPTADTVLGTLETIVSRLLLEQGGVKNLFDTRVMIEVYLVRHAATEAVKEDISALRSALRANEQAVDDSGKFYRTDTAFHEVLYRIPGNPLLPAIHRAYSTWLHPQWSRMPRMPERNQINYRSHEAIYEAILSRDPDESEAALRRHLHDAWRQVRRTFGDI